MSNKETGNEALVSREASEDEIYNFRLDEFIIRLMWKEPFFAEIFRIMRKKCTNKIPTAGVFIQDNEMHLWYNPKFMAGLTNAQVMGLLKHECYHLIYQHTTKRRHEPHIVWNYATDLAINSLIPEIELPEGGLIPGKEFTALTEEQKQQMGPKAAERYQLISQKIASFPKGEYSEWYFSQLMEDEEVKKAIESSDSMNGKSLSQALADGDIKVDEDGNLVDKNGNPVTVVPGSDNSDNHDGWDEMTDEQRDAIKASVQKAIESGVNKCNAKGQWGSIGAEMQGKLRKMISKEIPWQSVLKQFCGMTRRADRSASVRRLNRKYPAIHPGTKRNYRASIAVYLDQSGSVSDAHLEMLSGELEQLAGRVEFTLFNFDTSVDISSERTVKHRSSVTLDRTRCGGTDFQCVQDHANKNMKRFDGYLVLTDGYAPKTRGYNKLKRGWVIVPTGELQFEKPNRDFEIKMKGKK
jgi:predicted metal-dependent peptidase